jgi:hypothetical protein
MHCNGKYRTLKQGDALTFDLEEGTVMAVRRYGQILNFDGFDNKRIIIPSDDPSPLSRNVAMNMILLVSDLLNLDVKIGVTGKRVFADFFQERAKPRKRAKPHTR